MTKNKPVVVTGAAGFIGSHISQFLAKAGHFVVAIDDLSLGKKDNLPKADGIILDLGFSSLQTIPSNF